MGHASTQHAWRQPVGHSQPRRINRFCREVGPLPRDALAPGLDAVDIFELQEKDTPVGCHTGRDFERFAECESYLTECDATQAE